MKSNALQPLPTALVRVEDRMRRRCRWAAVVSLLLSTEHGARAGVPRWQLTFEDDFNGDALDRQRWSVRSCPCFRNGSWTDRAVSVKDGMLAIETTLNWTAAGRLEASSGHINTSSVWRSDGGGFSQRYGKFEVRARVPGAPGVSPALWMMPDDRAVCWPAGGELDIVETTCTGGQNPGGIPKFAWGSLHYSDNGECGAGPHHKAASGYWPCRFGDPRCHPHTNLADDFHVYVPGPFNTSSTRNAQPS